MDMTCLALNRCCASFGEVSTSRIALIICDRVDWLDIQIQASQETFSPRLRNFEQWSIKGQNSQLAIQSNWSTSKKKAKVSHPTCVSEWSGSVGAWISFAFSLSLDVENYIFSHPCFMSGCSPVSVCIINTLIALGPSWQSWLLHMTVSARAYGLCHNWCDWN